MFLALSVLLSFNSFAQNTVKAKALNPDVSANFLGLFRRGTAFSNDRTITPRNGLSLQEAELHFSADVDPYFKAVSLLSIAQESGSADFKVEPEEVYLETLSIPRLTLRAGKFKAPFGKHNPLHTHAFPFVDAPLTHQTVLGDEGLNEVGVSAALLLPTSWFSELTVQAFNPSNATLFQSPSSGDFGGLARWKNLWDLSDDLTLEVGGGGALGLNSFSRVASVVGADLTFKWRPSLGGKYHALVWQTEYLSGNRPGLTDGSGAPIETLGGLVTYLQYQFSERWWVGARYEYLGLPRPAALMVQDKESAMLGFFPSEFSGLRLQYDRHQNQTVVDHALSLQFIASIGAHPAHAY